jgi:hypothetical protein
MIEARTCETSLHIPHTRRLLNSSHAIFATGYLYTMDSKFYFSAGQVIRHPQKFLEKSYWVSQTIFPQSWLQNPLNSQRSAYRARSFDSFTWLIGFRDLLFRKIDNFGMQGQEYIGKKWMELGLYWASFCKIKIIEYKTWTLFLCWSSSVSGQVLSPDVRRAVTLPIKQGLLLKYIQSLCLSYTLLEWYLDYLDALVEGRLFASQLEARVLVSLFTLRWLLDSQIYSLSETMSVIHLSNWFLPLHIQLIYSQSELFP